MGGGSLEICGWKEIFFGREEKQRRERRKIFGEGKKYFLESEKKQEKEEIIMEKGIFLRLDGHCPLGKGIEGSKRGPRGHKKD